METKHYLILAAMLGSIGTQLAGLTHGWHDALTPAFIGGVVMQIATTLTAMFTGSPTQSTLSKMMPVVMLAALLSGGSLAMSACASTAGLSKEATVAVRADEVVTRIGAFQQTVIEASDRQLVEVATARTIVTWTKATIKALAVSPQGWQASARMTYPDVRKLVAANATLAPYLPVLDSLVGFALGGL